MPDQNHFNSEAEVNIKKANVLLQKSTFPFSLFSNYDPAAAAELLYKAGCLYEAGGSTSLAYDTFIKSAEAYALLSDCHSFTAKSYSKAGDTIKSRSRIKAAEAYEKSASYYSASGSNSIAATKKADAGHFYALDKDYVNAERVYKDTLILFDKSNMPANRFIALRPYFKMLVFNGNFETAGDVFIEIGNENSDKGFNLLIGYFCYLLAERGDLCEEVEENMSKEEKNVVKVVKNKEFGEVLETYLGRRTLSEEVKIIVDKVKQGKEEEEYDIL